MRILLIEDDGELARGLRRSLCGAGYSVGWEKRGDGLSLDTVGEEFDVAIVDVGLPGMDGFEIVEALRKSSVDLPVLFLSARGDVRDRVRGLQAGGDDYLVKPFSSEELIARLEALHRRASLRASADTGRIHVDVAARRFVEGDRFAELQPKELALLTILLKYQGQVLTKGFLLDKVWDIRFDPGTNVVDAMICRVRGKMEEAGLSSTISTIRGKGYVFCSGD